LFPLFKVVKHAAHRRKRKIRFDLLPRPSLHLTLVFSNQFEKADDLLPRRRFAERMSLKTRKGSLLDDCDDSAVTISPNVTASEAVTGRDHFLRDDVVAGRVSVSHEVRGAGRLCVAPEEESNQEIPGIAVRQARQVLSG